MNTKNIDIANIALMLVSCVAAFVVPFELFLFSYAVLGPLHYLTEISWLHKRSYFANGKKDYLWLLLLGVLLLLFTSCGFAGSMKPDSFVFLRVPLELTCDFMSPLISDFPYASNFFIFLAFASALAFIAFKDLLPKIIFVMVASVIGAMLVKADFFFLLFAVFLPTLIHVFIFTGLFILQGALKNRSVTGAASLIVFIVCACSFFIYYPHFDFYRASDYARQALSESTFIELNKSVMALLKSNDNVFESNVGLSVMRFIAFAYTYHYLNWFSKTQVIKWHQVPKKQLAGVIALWLLSVALYKYDYYTGLVALYFLSMLHVLLEFPLNYRSFVGIGQEIRTMTGGKPRPATVKK